MLDKDKAKPSVTAADKAIVFGTAADKAIVFAEREGFRALELDLYRAGGSSATSAPLIVFVHGGGWRIGHRRAPRETREWSDGFFERLCAAGFVVAAVSYRFSGEAEFPAQLDDVVDAMRWLHDHAAEVGIDPKHTYLWGASAGGTLAGLAALVPGAPRVRAAVIWYAVSDFLALDLQATDSFEAHLFGGPIGEHLDLARTASAVTYARADAPPILIQHGEADTWVPFDQALRLEKALQGVGASVELDAIPGADHFFGASPDVELIFERALAFLRRADSEPA